MKAYKTYNDQIVWVCGNWILGSNGKDVLIYAAIPPKSVEVEAGYPVGVRNALAYLQERYPGGLPHNILATFVSLFVRDLEKLESPKPKFVYSSYWGVWSRLVAVAGMHYVEVNMTPVNGWGSGDVERCKSVIVRCHCTARDWSDLEVDTLPDDVWAACNEHLGPEVTAFIASADFIELVDWTRYNQLCNGGASFYRIAKGVHHV